jgi:hypothetical protein
MARGREKWQINFGRSSKGQVNACSEMPIGAAALEAHGRMANALNQKTNVDSPVIS